MYSTQQNKKESTSRQAQENWYETNNILKANTHQHTHTTIHTYPYTPTHLPTDPHTHTPQRTHKAREIGGIQWRTVNEKDEREERQTTSSTVNGSQLFLKRWLGGWRFHFLGLLGFAPEQWHFWCSSKVWRWNQNVKHTRERRDGRHMILSLVQWTLAERERCLCAHIHGVKSLKEN